MSDKKQVSETNKKQVSETKEEGIVFSMQEISDIIRILQKLPWSDVNEIIVFLTQKIKKE